MRRWSVLLALLAVPAAAADSEVWQELGEWTVRVIQDGSSRCYASRIMEDGTEIQIGAEPTLDGGYFAAYNPDWTDIEDVEKGYVEFDFGTSRFGGDAVSKIENGVPGAYVFFDNPAFVQDLARKRTVIITGRDGAEFDMDLTGTSRMIRAVLACQDEQPEPKTEDAAD